MPSFDRAEWNGTLATVPKLGSDALPDGVGRVLRERHELVDGKQAGCAP